MAEPNLNPPDLTHQQIKFFLSKIERGDPSECWPYRGEIDNKGYGVIGFYRLRSRGRDKAHRLMYWITFGRWPAEMLCLHRCDNPPCVNPYHLFLGTQRENMDDKRRKGRAAKGDRHYSKTHPEWVVKGEQNGLSKLTAEQVLEIRAKYATGRYTKSALAREYGVSRASVRDIILRRYWIHI